MQFVLNDMVLAVMVASIVIALFSIAYIALIVTSNRTIIREQQSKIDEITKSQQRYKALFDNSLAGMMKFNFSTWMVLEANEAILEMFSVESTFELQRILTELPPDKRTFIEESLTRNGLTDGVEIQHRISEKMIRRYLFSARREGSDRTAQAVVVVMNSEKLIG